MNKILSICLAFSIIAVIALSMEVMNKSDVIKTRDIRISSLNDSIHRWQKLSNKLFTDAYIDTPKPQKVKISRDELISVLLRKQKEIAEKHKELKNGQ